MVTFIQAAQDRHFKQHAKQRSTRHTRAQPQPKRIGGRSHRGNQVSAHHVERAMREVDHVHDAKHERQARGQQEQHQTKLQAVERLLKQQYPIHVYRLGILQLAA